MRLQKSTVRRPLARTDMTMNMRPEFNVGTGIQIKLPAGDNSRIYWLVMSPVEWSDMVARVNAMIKLSK